MLQVELPEAMDRQRRTWTYLPSLLGISRALHFPPSACPIPLLLFLTIPSHLILPLFSFRMTCPLCLMFRLFSCIQYERSAETRMVASTYILTRNFFPLSFTLHHFLPNFDDI